MTRSEPGARDEDLSVSAAAARLGVHYMTAYRYIRSGRLPARQQGGQWRIAAEDLERFATRPAGRPPTGSGQPTIDGLTDQLCALLAIGDEQGAWHLIEGRLDAGALPAELIRAVLVPTMRRIGDRWEAGVMSVADEHTASTAMVRLLARLSASPLRRGRRRGTVVLGCPSGEHHSLPAHLFADLLRAHGLHVRDLGADTPPSSFVDALRTHPDAVLAISVTTSDGLDAVPATCRAVRSERPHQPIILGGAAATSDEQARSLGADHCATSLTAPELIDELLGRPRVRADQPPAGRGSRSP